MDNSVPNLPPQTVIGDASPYLRTKRDDRRGMKPVSAEFVAISQHVCPANRTHQGIWRTEPQFVADSRRQFECWKCSPNSSEQQSGKTGLQLDIAGEVKTNTLDSCWSATSLLPTWIVVVGSDSFGGLQLSVRLIVANRRLDRSHLHAFVGL